jgi:hypothetical protein
MWRCGKAETEQSLKQEVSMQADPDPYQRRFCAFPETHPVTIWLLVVAVLACRMTEYRESQT